MNTVSDYFILWAYQQYHDQIVELLDDPAWVCEDRPFWVNFISIGKELHIDFWEYIQRYPNEGQSERLLEILKLLKLEPTK